MVLRYFDQSVNMKRHEVGVYDASPLSAQAEIICESGVLWVTRSGDPEDHLLRPGECLMINQGGKVVIEALREARMRITSPENAN